MQALVPTAVASLPAWQAMLDTHAELFAELVPGAWVGIVPRYRTGLDGALHAVAVASTPPVPMVVLIREAGRMVARTSEFTGLQSMSADALFVANDDALAQALARAPAAALRELKRLVRNGTVALFFLRTRRELFERGYEEWFEALGLPVLGTCR